MKQSLTISVILLIVIFLLGFSVTWLDIFLSIDFPRNILDKILYSTSILAIIILLYIYVLKKNKIISSLFSKYILSLVLIPLFIFLLSLFYVYISWHYL
jgi:hypothetical protein